MKVAVVGSGYWGKNLVRNFSKLGALALICERNEILLEEFRQQYPTIKTCMAYEDVLADESVSGVVIATPAETHFQLAQEAILAGKSVYVEKPLALESREGERLCELADEHGVVLMVGHLLQYHSAFIRLKEMVASGELGRINYIYSNRLNLGKIRREENALWSFAPHDISMILALANEVPVSVAATGGNYLHKEIADVTTTHLEFPSGLKAHIFVSWLHPFKEQKLVVVGDRKMAVFDDTKPWEEKLVVYPHLINWEGNVPIPDKADAERVEVVECEPLRSECEHFLECIRGSLVPITDGREGVRVLEVLNEAQRSMDDRGCLRPQLKSLEGRMGVHSTAEVDADVVLGEGTKIWNYSRILKGSEIGKECRIGQNVVIGPGAKVGNGCKIQNNVSVYKGVTLEDEVFCGPSMVFTNVHNPRCHIPRMTELRETLVRKGATLGANSTIVCGNTIGRYAFVGAGAVVTKDVPDHALVMGNPARQEGWMCECGSRLNDDFGCGECGKDYRGQLQEVIDKGGVIKAGTFIHETALVDPRATVGKGTMVWKNAQIREYASVGEDCVVAKDVYIDINAVIGDRCKIQNGSSVFLGVHVEDEVFIGPHVAFTNDLIPRAFNGGWKASPTFVRKGASLGANVTVRCGVTIGEYAMVAAGSVVTKDDKQYSMVMGNPARHRYYVDRDGNQVDEAE